jgi:hypothetical protein
MQQARTAATRLAVANYAARSALPVRCSPETEKAILARLNGRPNDDDMVEVLATGMDKKFRDRWDCVRRNVILSSPEAIIIKNEIEQIESTDGTAKSTAAAAGSKNFRLLGNPRADILTDAKTACSVDLSSKKKVYFFDNLSIGVAKFARVKVDFVTDDASVAKFLSQILPKAPRSSIPRYFQPQSTALLLHSSSKDEQAGGLDSYVMYDSKTVIARGILPKLSPFLEAFSNIAAQRLINSDVLVTKGEIHRDGKSGAVSLVLGTTAPASGSEIQGTLYSAWGASGVSRLLEAGLSEKDESVSPLSQARTILPHPKRIVFATNKDGKAKAIDLEAAKKLYVEKYAVAPGEKTGPLFEKLVKDSKAELVLLE